MNALTKCIVWLGGIVLIAGTASAVTLSANGSGQVLIYPYYTVNAGQQSQLTLTNTSDDAKAIKLMIRGGAAGQAAFVLNVYLAAHDTWTGTLGEWGSGTAAGPILVSNDTNCTVPDLHADALPSLPNGRHYLRPNAGTLAPDSVIDEGYLVAIEMGTLKGDIATDIGVHSGQGSDFAPPDCAQPVARWAPGGIWSKDASTDVAAPGGGLSGTVTILDSAEGTVYRVAATALEDFRVAAMHTAPDATKPDLSDALSSADTGVASALIRVGNQIVRSDYPAGRTIDAVTAVLMAQKFTTRFDTRPGSGARTSFVISMPTKRFYVADSSKLIAPFGRDAYHRTSARGTLCPIIDPRGDGDTGFGKNFYFVFVGRFQVPPEQADLPLPCYATSVLSAVTLYPSGGLLGSKLTTLLGNNDNSHSAQSGAAFLTMNYYTTDCYADADLCFGRDQDYTRAHINIMRPDTEGRQYFGLPAIGFAATGYVNAYAGEKGVLRNFTFALPYQRDRACIQDGVVNGCH